MVRKWMSSLRMAQLAPREPGAHQSHARTRAAPADATTAFTIRRAVPKDVRTLAVLWREMMEFHRSLDPAFEFGSGAQASIERHLRETMRSTGGGVYVAEAGGHVIGYVLGEIQERKPIYPAGRYGFISDLAVTEGWRRRGVGRSLVGALMGWFQQHGVTAIELFILETNPVSTAFWESMGFRHYLRLLRRDATAAAEQSDQAGHQGEE
jgi:ribosomal protein S18 acetylase RimI-like enzyme